MFLNTFFSRVGTNPPEPLSPNLDGDSVPSYPHHHNHQHPIVNRSGQILWIRGLTRLQTQVCPFASTIIYVEIYTSEFTRRLGMNFKIVKFPIADIQSKMKKIKKYLITHEKNFTSIN